MPGKGDWQRPRPNNVTKAQYDAEFERVFGEKKLNVMSDEERAELELENQRLTEEPEGG